MQHAGLLTELIFKKQTCGGKKITTNQNHGIPQNEIDHFITAPHTKTRIRKLFAARPNSKAWYDRCHDDAAKPD